MFSKCTVKPDSKSKVGKKNETVCTRVRTRSVFWNLFFKKRLRLEHVCKVRSRLALLLCFYSVFHFGADFGSLGLFGRIFSDFFTDFIAIVKNSVRETAVRVHIGVQNCGKNAIFQSRLDKYSVFRNSSACLCT